MSVSFLNARQFTFSSQGSWLFKWSPDTRLVYIFRSNLAEHAQEAVPLDPDTDATYEAAQEAAKRWIRSRAGFGTPGFGQHLPKPKRHSSGSQRMIDSVTHKQDEVIKEKAQLLVAVSNNALSLDKAVTRIRVMAGDLPNVGYETKINHAFVELAKMYGLKSESENEPEDDGFPF